MRKAQAGIELMMLLSVLLMLMLALTLVFIKHASSTLHYANATVTLHDQLMNKTLEEIARWIE